MPDLRDEIAPGVVTGDDVQALFAMAQASQMAMPAVNVVGINTVNAVL